MEKKLNTKNRILNTLLIKQEASVNELAEEIGVNGISIRHHLKNFEKNGWVISREERQGQVGRPKFIYSLSSLGMEQFPSSYVEFSAIMVDQLKKVLGEEKLNAFFKEVGLVFAERNRLDRRQRNSPKRLVHVAENLNEQGYIIEKKEIDGKPALINYHCPYHYISTSNPVVCCLDQTMLEELTESSVEITQTIAQDKPCCIFVIKEAND
jgi:predicted ArsR family transcriptional regulator